MCDHLVLLPMLPSGFHMVAFNMEPEITLSSNHPVVGILVTIKFFHVEQEMQSFTSRVTQVEVD